MQEIGGLWVFSTCTGPERPPSTHASSKKSDAKTKSSNGAQGEKQSPRYLPSSGTDTRLAATACHASCPEIFCLAGGERLLSALVGETCGLRSAPDMGTRVLASIEARRGIETSSLTALLALWTPESSRTVRVPISSPTAGNRAWSL
jgi:hypothetical protein